MSNATYFVLPCPRVGQNGRRRDRDFWVMRRKHGQYEAPHPVLGPYPTAADASLGLDRLVKMAATQDQLAACRHPMDCRHYIKAKNYRCLVCGFQQFEEGAESAQEVAGGR